MSSVPSDSIVLISSDNISFTINRKVALLSGTIKNMLSSSFQESQTNEIRFPDINGNILEKVVEYLSYKGSRWLTKWNLRVILRVMFLNLLSNQK
jgi:transcription elongation factor B subunit 1